jgi:hypothetical protein
MLNPISDLALKTWWILSDQYSRVLSNCWKLDCYLLCSTILVWKLSRPWTHAWCQIVLMLNVVKTVPNLFFPLHNVKAWGIWCFCRLLCHLLGIKGDIPKRQEQEKRQVSWVYVLPDSDLSVCGCVLSACGCKDTLLCMYACIK